MMSLSTIRTMSAQRAAEARRKKKEPFVPFDEEEIKRWEFKMPALGDYVPPGWKMVEELFCDSSGFGSPNEPALTKQQLMNKMLEYERAGKSYGYAVTEAGQFQVYVGVYERTDKKPSKPARRRPKKPEPAIEVPDIITMSNVPSDDPLAYMAGFSNGVHGDELGPKKDLAKAYIEGHKFGQDVRFGRKSWPSWAKKG